MAEGAGPERDLATAYALLAEGMGPVRPSRALPLAEADGRVLAQAVVAGVDLPGEDVSAMDGYAVRCADLAAGPRALRLAGSALAGHPHADFLAPGTCVRIMTGAPLPRDADAVVVQESAAQLDDGTVLLPGPVAAGANRRGRGEHVRNGQTLLEAGRRLRAADLALAAAVGCAQLPVHARPRVGVLSTGDELRDAPAVLQAGGVYDSNRPLLLCALREAALDAQDCGICPDRPGDLRARLDAALDADLDAVLVSGGAAQGDADLVRALPGARFVPVNFRPGRGIVAAYVAREGRALWLLGLPGNAVAAFVLFHLLALPLLRRLGGDTSGPPRPWFLPLAQEQSVRAGRIDMRRAIVRIDPKAGVRVQPLAEQGSAMIRTVSAADALVAIGPEALLPAGSLVPVYPFRTAFD